MSLEVPPGVTLYLTRHGQTRANLEKRFSGCDDAEYPVCLDGQQACPPEDCGGAPGYYDLLEVLRNPDDERYEKMREWVGEGFDSQAFSVDAVNRQLRAGRVRRRSST